MAIAEPVDLIDAAVVAQILGLAHRNSVSTYRQRYADFPRPVRPGSRPLLWRASEVREWQQRYNVKSRDSSTVAARRGELVAAAVRLMTERPMATIGIREIAAEAGIAHSDIYRYVDSKDQLRGLAVAQACKDYAELIPADIGDLADEFKSLVVELYQRRALVRLLAMEALTNPDSAIEWPLSLSRIQAAIVSGSDPNDVGEAAVLATFIAALPLGWIIMEPRFRRALDLPAEIPAEEMAAAMRAMLASAGDPQ